MKNSIVVGLAKLLVVTIDDDKVQELFDATWEVEESGMNV